MRSVEWYYFQYAHAVCEFGIIRPISLQLLLVVQDTAQRQDKSNELASRLVPLVGWLKVNAILTLQVSAAADRPARRGASRAPTGLYTDVDNHQFITLPVHLS